MDLTCFDCLTDPDRVPGPTPPALAKTLYQGTAVCERHARELRSSTVGLPRSVPADPTRIDLNTVGF